MKFFVLKSKELTDDQQESIFQHFAQGKFKLLPYRIYSLSFKKDGKLYFPEIGSYTKLPIEGSSISNYQVRIDIIFEYDSHYEILWAFNQMGMDGSIGDVPRVGGVLVDKSPEDQVTYFEGYSRGQ
jgi:hypothetical protein